MSRRANSGLFVAEGTSDQPLAELMESLFCERGIELSLSQPAFERLSGVGKDVGSRVRAGLELTHRPVDLLVVHRDADSAGYDARLREIRTAVAQVSQDAALIPIIPVRMTEAWLLLDEAAIRKVAENPTGRTRLGLPKPHEVESVADPKVLLRDCILAAADVTGRRRERITRPGSTNIGVTCSRRSTRPVPSGGCAAGSAWWTRWSWWSRAGDDGSGGQPSVS